MMSERVYEKIIAAANQKVAAMKKIPKQHAGGAWHGALRFRNVFALQETQIWLYIRASAFDEEKEIGSSGPIRLRSSPREGTA
jgi:hypothetical protein